jgi:hypothetical protein
MRAFEAISDYKKCTLSLLRLLCGGAKPQTV